MTRHSCLAPPGRSLPSLTRPRLPCLSMTSLPGPSPSCLAMPCQTMPGHAGPDLACLATPRPAGPYRAGPSPPMTCHSCLAVPCLATPRLTEPYQAEPALPGLALPRRASPRHAGAKGCQAFVYCNPIDTAIDNASIDISIAVIIVDAFTLRLAPQLRWAYPASCLARASPTT